ncbi:MAG: hypothetical protein K8T89_19775 [Planctomycetes bacterium]|nr:hypothetical protein [Planctomycetota bacterium]
MQVCLAFCLAALATFSQISVADDDEPPTRPAIPVVGRPSAHFYQAAGTGVTIKAEATPTELASNEWLTYTLTINKLLNGAQVEKPSLKMLPEFAAFQIDEGASLDPDAEAGRRIFVFRLRPSSDQVKLIPEIAFHYYDPKRIVSAQKPQDKFPRIYSNSVPIHVVPPIAPPSKLPTPLDVPGFAVNLATNDEILAPSSRSFLSLLWLPALLVPPLLAIGWVLMWRTLFPNSARLRKLKRNRAARVALSALAHSRRHSPEDPGAAIAHIMIDYLRERFDLPGTSNTPREIAWHLRSIPLPYARCDQAFDFFQACDTARYSRDATDRAKLATDAERLLVVLEEPA